MTIKTRPEFPMKVGDRLFIRHGAAMERIVVTREVMKNEVVCLHEGHTETVKYPARHHGSARAIQFGR